MGHGHMRVRLRLLEASKKQPPLTEVSACVSTLTMASLTLAVPLVPLSRTEGFFYDGS